MPAVGSLSVYLTAKTKKFERSMIRAQKQVKAFSIGVAKASIASGALIGGVAIASAIKFTKVATDAEEAVQKFGVVYKDVAVQANASAQEIAKGFGLSSVTAKELLGDTGDLLTGFGFTAQSALDMSVATNKLAMDLASFTNYEKGASGAAQALIKGMSGEREAMKALGIVVREDMVMNVLRAKNQEKLTGLALVQAKAQATLEIATKQSKNAIGDYARTSGGMANQMRLVNERFKDLQVHIGTFLIKGLKLPELLTKINNKMREWSDLMGSGFLEFFLINVEFTFKQAWVPIDVFFQNVAIGIVNIQSRFKTLLEWLPSAFARAFDKIPKLWNPVELGKQIKKQGLGALKNLNPLELGKAMKVKGPAFDALLPFKSIEVERGKLEAERLKRTAELQTKLQKQITDKVGGGLSIPKGISIATANKASSKFSGAVQKGTVEAYKAEIGVQNVDKKIEQNTKKSVKLQEEMVRESKRPKLDALGLAIIGV